MNGASPDGIKSVGILHCMCHIGNLGGRTPSDTVEVEVTGDFNCNFGFYFAVG